MLRSVDVADSWCSGLFDVADAKFLFPVKSTSCNLLFRTRIEKRLRCGVVSLRFNNFAFFHKFYLYIVQYEQ